MQVAHNKARLEAFSDGVFAIAITLLALELHVPELKSYTLSGGIAEVLPLFPNILTFVLSFMTIAIFWVNHHQLTQDVGPIQRRILWTNILLLLFITLIPFGTKVASENPTHSLAIFTYATILFSGSVSFTILRYYVHRSCGEHKVLMRRSYVGPLLYGCAVVASLFFIPLAYFFLAVPPLFYFLPKNRTHSTE